MEKDGTIKNHVLALLGSDRVRMTPADLALAVSRKMPTIRRAALRKTIKAMVTEGVLVYTNHFNTTHLELNFNRPVQVSRRVTLCPAGLNPPEKSEAITLKLKDGAAFGLGDHPTTRLCVKGLDDVLSQQWDAGQLAAMTALDIGTGSGVLAMAVVAMGVGKAVGIDIDPMACNEARANLAINEMNDRITITDEPLSENLQIRPCVIIANLRPPTLKSLFPVMEKISRQNAIWVLSGFRQEEEKAVVRFLPGKISNILWRSQEQGWAAMVAALT